MQKRSWDIGVGLLVLLGIAALFFLAIRVSNPEGFQDKKGIDVNVYFDNIGGLRVDAPVKSSGVVVGRVKTITFDDTVYKAKVVIRLFSPYQFSKDSSASILTAGLLGEQYLGLETGGDLDMLKNGDTIKLTSSAMVLEQLISRFMFNKAGEPSGGGSSSK